MAEIIDNEAINNRLSDEETSEVFSKASEEAITKNGMNNLFKPRSDWESELQEDMNNDTRNGSTNIYAPANIKATAEAKVRKPRTVTPAKNTPSAKVDVGSAIQKLEEKVKLLKYVESVTVPEVPTGMSKEGREILLQIGREMEELKARKIAAITKL